MEFGHKLFDSSKKRVVSIDRDSGTYQRVNSNGRCGRRSIPEDDLHIKMWRYQPYTTEELIAEMQQELMFSERVYSKKTNEPGGTSAYINRMAKMKSIKAILDDRLYNEEQEEKKKALKKGTQETLF